VQTPSNEVDMKLSTDMMRDWRALNSKWNKKNRDLASIGSKLTGGSNGGVRIYIQKKRNRKSNPTNSESTSDKRYEGGVDRETARLLDQPKNDDNA